MIPTLVLILAVATTLAFSRAQFSDLGRTPDDVPPAFVYHRLADSDGRDGARVEGLAKAGGDLAQGVPMPERPDADTLLNARLADIASLGGEAALTGILGRFSDHLAAVLDSAEWPEAEAHRVVGLAGMLGFSEVEQAWRRIENEASSTAEARDEARHTAQAAMAFIARRLSSATEG